MANQGGYIDNGVLNNVYVGNRYIPVAAGVWDETTPYESLVMVTDGQDAYISTRPVPAGTPLTDGVYWLKFFPGNEVLDRLRNDVDTLNSELVQNVETLTTALQEERVVRMDADAELTDNLSNLKTSVQDDVKELDNRVSQLEQAGGITPPADQGVGWMTATELIRDYTPDGEGRYGKDLWETIAHTPTIIDRPVTIVLAQDAYYAYAPLILSSSSLTILPENTTALGMIDFYGAVTCISGDIQSQFTMTFHNVTSLSGERINSKMAGHYYTDRTVMPTAPPAGSEVTGVCTISNMCRKIKFTDCIVNVAYASAFSDCTFENCRINMTSGTTSTTINGKNTFTDCIINIPMRTAGEVHMLRCRSELTNQVLIQGLAEGGKLVAKDTVLNSATWQPVQAITATSTGTTDIEIDGWSSSSDTLEPRITNAANIVRTNVTMRNLKGVTVTASYNMIFEDCDITPLNWAEGAVYRNCTLTPTLANTFTRIAPLLVENCIIELPEGSNKVFGRENMTFVNCVFKAAAGATAANVEIMNPAAGTSGVIINTYCDTILFGWDGSAGNWEVLNSFGETSTGGGTYTPPGTANGLDIMIYPAINAVAISQTAGDAVHYHEFQNILHLPAYYDSESGACYINLLIKSLPDAVTSSYSIWKFYINNEEVSATQVLQQDNTISFRLPLTTALVTAKKAMSLYFFLAARMKENQRTINYTWTGIITPIITY